MEFDDVIAKRNSARKFNRKKPSWKDILEAVDAAVQGPFASNKNNLRFLIVEGEKKIEEIAEVCEQEWVADCKVMVLVCSDDAYLEKIFGEKGRIYSRQQAGAAVYAFCLKLTDLGLDSCWVGAYDDNAVREKLKIPGNIQIEAIIPIGYASDSSEKKRKPNLESVLYWEEWNNNRRKTSFEEGRELIGSKILKDEKK